MRAFSRWPIASCGDASVEGHLPGFGQGQTPHGEHFIALGVGRAKMQTLRQKDRPSFVRHRIGQMDRAEVCPCARHDAGFFGQFALGAFQRRTGQCAAAFGDFPGI